MKYLKLVILLTILLNIPGFFLAHVSAIAGTILSYSTFALIIVYYTFNKKEKPIVSFVVLGLLYFFISTLVEVQNDTILYSTFIKYFIFVILGAKVVKDSKDIEIFIILLLGSLSIIYDLIFISGIEGRFSGFYLNPNLAGFVCILGYCMSFSITNKKLKIFGQLMFSFAGIVTFSRTFLVIWLFVNIISLTTNFKNIYKIIAVIFLIGLFLTFGDKLNFNRQRLNSFSSLFEGKVTEDLENDSRTDVWATYYDKILDRPIFGNGYLSLSGKPHIQVDGSTRIQGVHNTFLMIMGEAGIIVFMYFLYIYGKILISSYKIFRFKPLYFFISVSVVLYMLTSHNYFDNYFMLFISIWVFIQLNDIKLVIYKKFNKYTGTGRRIFNQKQFITRSKKF